MIYEQFAVAFVCGRLQQMGATDVDTPVRELEASTCGADIKWALSAGKTYDLPLHYFKRVRMLSRIQWALGVLRTLQPNNLLDIGSGRGKFLWPLLDAFPYLPVTAVDADAKRVRDLQAVSLGGIDRLTVRQVDATSLPFADASFPVVTLLEVLEHIPVPEQVLREVVRVTQQHVLLSVPSKPDDNPEHLHLFTEDRLHPLFAAAGVTYIKVQHVPGHLLVLASVNNAG